MRLEALPLIISKSEPIALQIGIGVLCRFNACDEQLATYFFSFTREDIRPLKRNNYRIH